MAVTRENYRKLFSLGKFKVLIGKCMKKNSRDTPEVKRLLSKLKDICRLAGVPQVLQSCSQNQRVYLQTRIDLTDEKPQCCVDSCGHRESEGCRDCSAELALPLWGRCTRHYLLGLLQREFIPWKGPNVKTKIVFL